MDYNEILCQAIDTIVAKRISEISYDQTIICTIIDDSDKENGRYKVQSNDQLKFDAYCENTTYKNGYQVNVLVPNGDFSLKKTILGRYTANNDTEPVAYVSPLEKVVQMTPNYAINANTPVGLTANGKQQVYGSGPIFKATNIGRLPYDTLCIKADFKCQLQNYLIRTGNYGLRIIITTDKEVVDVSLDSAKDMFGNPYGFISYFTQEQTYHINLKGSIESIQGYFYQRSNFTYYDSQEEFDPMVPVLMDGTTEVPNIFINNIEVFFGYDVSQIEDNTVEIYTADVDYYSSTSNLTKNFTLMWYNKTEENKYLGFTDGIFNKEMAKKEERDPEDTNIYYWVEWYRDNNDETWPVVGEWGTNLGLNDKITYRGTCHDLYSETSFKARVYCNGNYYESNVLTFTNQTLANADSTNALDVALNIHHGEHSEDAYPYYGADNMLINIADARRARALWFSYESTVGAILEPSVLDGAKVLWYIPLTATMLEASTKNTYPLLTKTVLQNWINEAIINLGDIEEALKAELSVKLQEQFMGYLLPGFNCYYTILNAADGEAPTQEEKTFYYQIKKAFNASNMNNIIKLKVVDKNCHEYNAEKSFAFATSGSCGTDYSLIISEVNGYPAYAGQANYALAAKLYDGDFQDITPTSGIRVSYTTPSSASDYKIATASTSVEWSGNAVQLSAEYPIAWAASPNYYYQGPTSIVYDSSGVNPNYYNGELAIFNNNNEKLSGVSWHIHYTTSDPDIIQYLPSVHYYSAKGYYYLKAKNMYMHDLDNVKMTLVASQGGAPIWGQPLLIYQNQYASALLNKWGGEMVIDKEGNYILTAMIGAGIKNEDNTFSGVLMGDVGKKTGDKSMNAIGLYGIHEGAQSFGLKIDGTMFLGKSGRGQIVFDGNNGFIYSGNWMQAIKNEGKNPFSIRKINGVEELCLTESTDGMAIDLQHGQIDAFNFKLTSNNVKFDSHKLDEGEEHFYHMNIETNPLATEEELILRENEVGFRILEGHKYYLDAEGTQLYTGTDYPEKDIIYEQIITEIYTAVPAEDWPTDVDGDGTFIGPAIGSGEYYIQNADGSYSAYTGSTYPIDGVIYTKSVETTYIKVPDDKTGPLEGSNKYYYDNTGTTEYTEANYPVAPVLYEQTMRGHGYYHIRFKSDGTLELSIANSTGLADLGITMGDLITDIDNEFVYIEDEVIGNPENPKAGTVYDHVAGEIGRIEDEVIGLPPTLTGGNVYSYINGQSYMTSEGVFNGLTDNGTKKGIFYRTMPTQVRVPAEDSYGNPIYDAQGNRVYELKVQEDGKELYINANYIRAGILASSNWKGKLVHHTTPPKIYDSEDEVAVAMARGEDDWDDNEWSLIAKEGTYWDLDKGQLWAAKFELNAWTNKEVITTADGAVLDTNSGAGGLYLNSHPEAEGYYLSVGNTEATEIGDKVINPNFIQYSAEGVLEIKMNEFVLQASGDIYDDPDNPAFKGIYLNSSPGAEDYYLLIGQPGNFMSLDAEGKMIFQTNNTFIVNAWHPAGDGHSEYEHGIYMNSDGGITTDIYGNEYKKVYFRAGYGDMDSVYDDTSELIEISEDRVLIASKNFILDAYDHTLMTVPGGSAEKGGIYLNSIPAENDLYLHIGRSDRYIQYSANQELKMCVDELIIDAYNNLSVNGIEGASGGLYLNSAPEPNGYYLIVGKPGNFIQLAENGNMTFQTNGKFVINALNDGAGFLINSQPEKSNGKKVYFQLGDESSSYMQYYIKDGKGVMYVHGTISALAGDIGGWKIERWEPDKGRIYGEWGSYMLSLWSAFPEAECEKDTGSRSATVSGLSSENWRIQAGETDKYGYNFPNGFGVTREGEIAATYGIIAGWHLSEKGLVKFWQDNDKLETDIPAAAFLMPGNDIIGGASSIGGSPVSQYQWGLVVGDNFGVDYTKGIFANKGKIGGWVLDDTDLYYGTSKDDSVTILKGDTGTITTTNLQVYEKLTVDKAKVATYNMRSIINNRPTVDIIGGGGGSSSGGESGGEGEGDDGGETGGAVVVVSPLTQINGDILIDGNTQISGTTRLLGVVNVGSSTAAADFNVSGKSNLIGNVKLGGSLEVYCGNNITTGTPVMKVVQTGTAADGNGSGLWITSDYCVINTSKRSYIGVNGNHTCHLNGTLLAQGDFYYSGAIYCTNFSDPDKAQKQGTSGDLEYLAAGWKTKKARFINGILVDADITSSDDGQSASSALPGIAGNAGKFLQVNNGATATHWTSLYAPTDTGTSGQVWISTGSGGAWGYVKKKLDVTMTTTMDMDGYYVISGEYSPTYTYVERPGTADAIGTYVATGEEVAGKTYEVKCTANYTWKDYSVSNAPKYTYTSASDKSLTIKGNTGEITFEGTTGSASSSESVTISGTIQ